MKVKLLITIAFSILLVSCKDYLHVVPQGTTIPQTDEEFEALISTLLYDIEWGWDQYVIGSYDTVIRYESISDNLDANIKVDQLKLYAGDDVVLRYFQSGQYRSLYSINRDCNIIIDNMKDRSSEKARKLCAAAYSIKGVCYYNLIRLFCEPFGGGRENTRPGVPIIDRFDVESYEVPDRKTIKESYEYAVSLFTKSLAYEMTDGLYVFNVDVTKAFLAKLHFWAGQWEKTIPLCDELLAVPSFAVAERSAYESMVQAYSEKKQEVIIRERIYEDSELKQFYKAEFEQYLATRPVNATLIKLFGSEPEKDIRWGIMCDKKRFNKKTVSSKVRGSEFCLMLAECYAHLGGAANDEKALGLLNELRRKRILDVVDYTMSSLPQPDQNALIKVDAEGNALSPLLSAIFDERRKELYMEGDRWFELKRNGRPEWWVIVQSGSTLPVKYTTKEYLYTMPISVHDVVMGEGKIKQNPGYEY